MNLWRAEKVGGRPTRSGDETRLGHLGCRVERSEIRQKAARHAQTAGYSTSCSEGFRRARPVHGELGTEWPLLSMLGDKPDEVPQEGAVGAHLTSNGLAQINIGVQVLQETIGVHDTPPGHGRATSAKASKLSLA